MRYLTPPRCWRVRLVEAIPNALLDYPFSVTLAILASVYGPTALAGSPIGAIGFLPHPTDHLWGATMTYGAITLWAALARRRVGTWLPVGLWVCSLALIAYVVLVVGSANLDDYLARTLFSAVVGSIGIVQAFKLQTGHMWAVAAIRLADDDEGERRAE